MWCGGWCLTAAPQREHTPAGACCAGKQRAGKGPVRHLGGSKPPNYSPTLQTRCQAACHGAHCEPETACTGAKAQQGVECWSQSACCRQRIALPARGASCLTMYETLLSTGQASTPAGVAMRRLALQQITPCQLQCASGVVTPMSCPLQLVLLVHVDPFRLMYSCCNALRCCSWHAVSHVVFEEAAQADREHKSHPANSNCKAAAMSSSDDQHPALRQPSLDHRSCLLMRSCRYVSISRLVFHIGAQSQNMGSQCGIAVCAARTWQVAFANAKGCFFANSSRSIEWCVVQFNPSRPHNNWWCTPVSTFGDHPAGMLAVVVLELHFAQALQCGLCRLALQAGCCQGV